MTDKPKVLLAMTTVPDQVVGVHISEALIREGLAACVSRIPGVTSTYIWGGAVQSETEQLLLIKTTEERFESLRSRIKALHPYELPELVAVDVAAGAGNYLDWVRKSVGHNAAGDAGRPGRGRDPST